MKVNVMSQRPRIQDACNTSCVKFPQLMMICNAMSSDGAGPLCLIKSKVNVAVHHEILELPSGGKLFGDANFLF